MTINYTPLLESVYQSIMEASIEEIPYWMNIADNLKALKKETFVSVGGLSPIHEFVFNTCMECNLTEVEYYFVRRKFDEYVRGGMMKEKALTTAFYDVLGSEE